MGRGRGRGGRKREGKRELGRGLEAEGGLLKGRGRGSEEREGGEGGKTGQSEGVEWGMESLK